MTVHFAGLTLDWLGYATTRIESDADQSAEPGRKRDGSVVYLDPGRYGVLDDYDARDGDVVCVTHDHHYDSDGIERVAEEDATIIVYEGVDTANIDRDVTPVDDLDFSVIRLGERDETVVGDVSVRSLPGYNEVGGPNDDGDGNVPHPEGFGVGYLVGVGEKNVFYPGDSDALGFYDSLVVDVLLPPISHSYTMTQDDAAALAGRLDPGLVMPVHYDTFDALEADEDRFVADVAHEQVPVVLDDPNEQ
ncbi:MBL fold metallo-hydrolase [Halocalculus aciditolerans]|uniref:MBL fold metallo-hydrolase n=1 Tax=Halocalculus aciditolerans TaxID=1383812 RepID=UPI00166E033D|nr:MBL fold metallo-hydrolase [Halocalculus aciditolerans]